MKLFTNVVLTAISLAMPLAADHNAYNHDGHIESYYGDEHVNSYMGMDMSTRTITKHTAIPILGNAVNQMPSR